MIAPSSSTNRATVAKSRSASASPRKPSGRDTSERWRPATGTTPEVQASAGRPFRGTGAPRRCARRRALDRHRSRRGRGARTCSVRSAASSPRARLRGATRARGAHRRSGSRSGPSSRRGCPSQRYRACRTTARGALSGLTGSASPNRRFAARSFSTMPGSRSTRSRSPRSNRYPNRSKKPSDALLVSSGNTPSRPGTRTPSTLPHATTTA